MTKIINNITLRNYQPVPYYPQQQPQPIQQTIQPDVVENNYFVDNTPLNQPPQPQPQFTEVQYQQKKTEVDLTKPVSINATAGFWTIFTFILVFLLFGRN